MLTEGRMATLFPEDSGLLKAYQTLLPRLYVLKARDDFWAWVELQFPGARPDRAREVSSELRATLLGNLKNLSATPPTAASLRLLPIRLIGNLWLPFTVWSLAAYLLVKTEKAELMADLFQLGLKTPEGFFVVLAVCLAWATLISFLFSPFLEPWRRIARRRHPLLAASALTFTLLLVATGLIWSGAIVWWSNPKLMMGYYELELPFELLLAPIHLNLLALTSGTALASVLIPVSFFWPVCALYKRLAWADFRAIHRGRVVFSVLLLLPLLIGPWEFTQAVWNGRELRPELQAILDSPTPTASPKDSALAKRFLESPSHSAERWLQMGSKIWQTEKWWTHPEYEAYCDAFRQVGGIYYFERSGSGFEAAIRTNFADGGWFDIERVAEVELNEQEWERIITLLSEAVILNCERASSYSYAQAFRELLGQEHPWGTFLYFETRAFANEAWDVLQESPELHQPEGLLQLSTVEQARNMQTGRDLLIVYRAEEESKCRIWSVALIGAIVQREIAAKRPIPTDLNSLDLPPESGQLEWYHLEVRPEAVQVWCENPILDGYQQEKLTIPRLTE